jgi:hypothetical protein
MMKIISFVILLICSTSTRLLALDMVTLSNGNNQIHMKRGKYVDKVWIGPGFSKKNGFTISDINYSVEVNNDVLVDYLPTAFNSLEKRNTSYNLVVTVVKFSEKIRSTRPYNTNQIRIDGRIFNHRKELIAAFQIERTFQKSVADAKFAVDNIVRAVKKELR